MPCKGMDEKLSAYMDGGLLGAELREVSRHLAVCSPCSLRLKVLEAGRAALRKSAPRPQLPADVKAALKAAAAQAARPQRSWWRLPSLGMPFPAVPALGLAGLALIALAVYEKNVNKTDEISVDELIEASHGSL
jgi:anti-sigma factor RsiW